MNFIRNLRIFVVKNWYKFLIGFILTSYIEVILPALDDILTALRGEGTTYDFSVLGVTLNSLRENGGSYGHLVSIWYNPVAVTVGMLQQLSFQNYSQIVAVWGLSLTWVYIIPATYGLFFMIFAVATSFVFLICWAISALRNKKRS